jgi:hypothetical protein
MYLVQLYVKHAMLMLIIIKCDSVHETNKSRPILIKFNESWPNVAQWFRTQEEPKIENSNSERCDIAGLLLVYLVRLHTIPRLDSRPMQNYAPRRCTRGSCSRLPAGRNKQNERAGRNW